MNKLGVVYRLILLVLCVLCGSKISLGAEVVQIGTGSMYNQSMPMEPFAQYSYSQSIYLSAEVGTPGVISQIGWQYRVSGTIFLDYTNQISIYLGISHRTGFSSASDWLPADSLSLVFSGTLSPPWFSTALPGQGWLTVPLQTAFDYSGDSNLVIAVDENMPGYSTTSDDFACHNTGFACSLEFHSFTVNPNVSSPPPSFTGSPVTVRPNLKLEIEPVLYVPYSPLPADQATDVPVDVILAWQSAADSWDVWFAPSGLPLVQVAANLTQLCWTPPQDLALYHSYQWRITAHSEGVTYEGSTWSFTTAGEVLTAPQGLAAVCMGQTVLLEWTPPSQGSIMSYRIYRNNIQIEECQTLQFTDAGVSTNQTYSYYVKAVNHLNQISPPSNPATVTVTGFQTFLYQSFETAGDFSTTIPGWTILDEDHSPTWQWENTSFPGEGSQLGWIVFNPSQTNPPVNAVLPSNGSRMLLSMSALNPPNNDWLISPPLVLPPGIELTFKVRSYSADFGLERLRVLISTTDSLTGSFQPLSAEPWLTLPASWTEYSYDLSAYSGQLVYLAWQSVSWDAFALCLDDILFTQHVANSDNVNVNIPEFQVYPNPAGEQFVVTSSSKAAFDLAIYNVKGQQILQKHNIAEFGWKKSSGVQLPAGIYLLQLSQGSRTTGKRIVIF